MTMTVRDLIDLLENEEPDAEVRFMSQPSWPFEYDIDINLWHPDDAEDEEEQFAPSDPPDAGVVYLVEGTQLGYGTAEAWRS